jgi:hypothetical protein
MSMKDKMKLPKKKALKVRKTWGELNPTTKVEESEKKYNRNKEKRNVRREYFECEG